jgi:hypothetical protein
MSRGRTELEYDVALSFAGEDRAQADALAEALTANQVRVFYDRYEQADLWGKDLYQHFQHVYRDSAHYCIILISTAYANRLWTRHELRQAQARAFEENEEYILPLRLDDTILPGLNRTVGYIDLRTCSLSDVVRLVQTKLRRYVSAAVSHTGSATQPRQSVIGKFVDPSEFERTSTALLDSLRRDPRLVDILNGPHLPICLPQCTIGDYGGAIEDLMLPPVAKAYEAAFAGRRFENRLKGKLRGKLTIARASRQEALLGRIAEGPVVGIQFPATLQGYSVLAAQEQLAELPAGFVLSGTLDTCAAILTYPEVLGAEHAPTLVCAGTDLEPQLSLCFHPNDRSLTLCVADESIAIGSFSPGLLYIG